MKNRSIRTLLLASCLLSMVVAASAPAQEDAEEAAGLEVEAILVEPDNPGPDTLCKLRVRIHNNGSETASQFGFTVTLNGDELSVYGNQLFMYPVPAGESLEFPLYNFWTTETSRPDPPANGKLELEVAIREAQWMKIEMEDDVEVWTPLGAVDGLPAGNSLTVTMASGS